MDLVKLQFNHYNEDYYVDKAIVFAVPKQWLMETLDLKDASELRTFLEEYTSSESHDVYVSASLQHKLVYEFDSLHMSVDEIKEASRNAEEKAFAHRSLDDQIKSASTRAGASRSHTPAKDREVEHQL